MKGKKINVVSHGAGVKKNPVSFTGRRDVYLFVSHYKQNRKQEQVIYVTWQNVLNFL